MFRMQRDLQRSGRVAGVAAAMAVKETTPRQVDVRRLREEAVALWHSTRGIGGIRASGTVWRDESPRWTHLSRKRRCGSWRTPARDDRAPQEVLKNGSELGALLGHQWPWRDTPSARQLYGAPPLPDRARGSPNEGLSHGSLLAGGVVVLLSRIGDPAAVPENQRACREPERPR